MIKAIILSRAWQLLTNKECLVHNNLGMTYQITYMDTMETPSNNAHYFEIGTVTEAQLYGNRGKPWLWVRKSNEKTAALTLSYYII